MNHRSNMQLVRGACIAAILLISAFPSAHADSDFQWASGWTVNNNADWTPFPPATNPLSAPDVVCVDASAPVNSWAEFTFPAFSFPAGSTLTGIEVEVVYVSKSSGNQVQLTDGGSLVGAVKPTAAVAPVEVFCSNAAPVSAGGDGDLWGTSLTLADFAAGTVGVRFTKLANDIGLDAIRLIVHFQPPITNDPPTAEANGPYNVDEGDSVTLSSAGSSDPEDGTSLTYEWDLDDDGTYETPGASPSFSAASIDGPDTRTVGLRVTDSEGLTATDTATVEVANVAPTISAVTNDGPIDEGESATVSVTASDPAGGADPLQYSFDCRNDGTFEIGPQASGSASCAFGDNGTFTVAVQVEDDDGGEDDGSTDVVVDNLAPTATLDVSGAISFPGGDVFIGSQGVEQSHQADGSDPGSDDLDFLWDFDVSTQSTTYFNDTGDPSGSPDPAASPDGTYPFAIAGDSASVTFTAPGLYTVEVVVSDDDGLSDSEQLAKIVTGDGECAKSQGFWSHQARGKGRRHVDSVTLEAMLALVDTVSSYFSEITPALTIAEAAEVMAPSGNSKRRKAERQTLAAWLNFASGAVALDEPIDVDGDSTPDTTFLQLITEVELILTDPAATDAELLSAKSLAELVNLLDQDDPGCE